MAFHSNAFLVNARDDHNAKVFVVEFCWRHDARIVDRTELNDDGHPLCLPRSTWMQHRGSEMSLILLECLLIPSP